MLVKICGEEILAEIGFDLPFSRRQKKKVLSSVFLNFFHSNCLCLLSFSNNALSGTETKVGGFCTKFLHSLHFCPLHKKLEFSSPVCWLHFPQVAWWRALGQQSVVDLREMPLWPMALGTPPWTGEGGGCVAVPRVAA